MIFRDLTKDDIEVRIQSVYDTQYNKGLILLLYKNARVDMNILDATVGAENWQREHYECKGNLFCRVGIRTIRNDNETVFEWVYKSDCGTESNTESQKGEASDSFKRACFNWGIGRELYTSPFIWITPENCNIKDGKCKDRFAVEKIVIEDKKIKAISIINTTQGKRAFVWQEQPNAKE